MLPEHGRVGHRRAEPPLTVEVLSEDVAGRRQDLREVALRGRGQLERCLAELFCFQLLDADGLGELLGEAAVEGRRGKRRRRFGFRLAAAIAARLVALTCPSFLPPSLGLGGLLRPLQPELLPLESQRQGRRRIPLHLRRGRGRGRGSVISVADGAADSVFEVGLQNDPAPRSSNDLVVDIGHIHHEVHVQVKPVLEHAPDDVEGNVGAGVALLGRESFEFFFGEGRGRKKGVSEKGFFFNRAIGRKNFLQLFSLLSPSLSVLTMCAES